MPAKRIIEHTSANYPIIPLEDIENTSGNCTDSSLII